MELQKLIEAAQLSAEHTAAIKRHDLAATIANHVASRKYGSGSLSSACLTALIDRGAIAGHAMGQDTLKRFDSTLAEGIAKLEAALPKINHGLEVVDSDPFAGG